MFFSLERFEDTLAVLQDDEENTVIVDKALLPPEAVAGQIFRFCDGRYDYEEAETAKRRDRIRRLEQLLRGNKR